MTQEAFKAWWYNEGSQAPYTHHDCEQHTMRMCEIAWANGAYKALADPMREVQRLGQEIEQEPVALHCCGYTDASAVKWNPLNGVVQCHNCGQTYTPPQRTEQEPTAKYSDIVSDGGLDPRNKFDAQVQRKPLTDEEMKKIWYAMQNIMGWYSFQEIARAIEAAHNIKENT